MCQQAHLKMPSAPASMAAARAWVAAQLDDLYATLPSVLRDDVALIVSELATNCVRNAPGGFELDLDVHHAWLTIAATDTAPGMPTRRAPAPVAASGRGLNIIAALAERWGVTPRDAGKTVWVQLGLPQHAGPSFTCDLPPDARG